LLQHGGKVSGKALGLFDIVGGAIEQHAKGARYRCTVSAAILRQP
jgi:hypothetical protein